MLIWLSLAFIIPCVISKGANICRNKECGQAAAFISGNIDKRIKPCDDFYQFACGRFGTFKKGKSSVTRYNVFEHVQYAVIKQLESILKNTSKDDIRPVQLARDFYNSCINDNTSHHDGIKLTQQKISSFVDWPAITWSKKHSWMETVRKFRNAGFKTNYLLTVDVVKNRVNRFNMPLMLMPPELNLNTETLKHGVLNEDVFKKYYELLLDICQRFNDLSPNRLRVETVEKRFIESFKFEIKLANIVSSTDRTKFQVINFETAQYRYPSIHWRQFVQAIVGSSYQITTLEPIVVLPQLMERLNKLLKSTPNGVINDYLIWSNVFYALKLIDQIYEKTRENHCVILTAERFENVLTPPYVRKYFPKSNRENIMEIVRRVKSELQKSISNSSWLDFKSRKNALDKLDSIETIIGFSDDRLKLEQFYENIYQNLRLNLSNYFESTLSLQKFELDLKFLSRRNSTFDIMLNSMNPFDVNGIYESEGNSICFFIGLLVRAFTNSGTGLKNGILHQCGLLMQFAQIIRAAALQNIFYSVRRPNYLNYGFVGFMIGHEFSHAFDDENYKYDKNGKMRNWSSPKTRKMYYQKRMCFIRHYNNYTVDGKQELKTMNLKCCFVRIFIYRHEHVLDGDTVKVDGLRTLDENMSDYEGIKAAYNAYTSWLETNGREKMLPRLFFTNKQMFWISAATMWCSKFSTPHLNHLAQNSTHSLPKIRINALVSIINEFSRDFRCPAKSKMNSPIKCSLWR